MEYRLISDDSGDPGFTGPVGRVFDPVSSWVDFSSPITITHFPPRLCDRNSPFSWTREISRVFSARTQESEECRALIYTTVREVFAVELPATLFSAFATSCKTTSASFEARNTSPPQSFASSILGNGTRVENFLFARVSTLFFRLAALCVVTTRCVAKYHYKSCLKVSILTSNFAIISLIREHL